MKEVTVITGVERRRAWSDDEKQKIMAAAFAPGANVRDVARRFDVGANTIYRWRLEHLSPKGLAQMVLAAPPAETAPPAKFIEIVLGTKGSIRIPVDTPAELAAAVMKASFGR